MRSQLGRKRRCVSDATLPDPSQRLFRPKQRVSQTKLSGLGIKIVSAAVFCGQNNAETGYCPLSNCNCNEAFIKRHLVMIQRRSWPKSVTSSKTVTNEKGFQTLSGQRKSIS